MKNLAKVLIVPSILTCVLMVTCAAQAALVFEDNFEADTLNVAPDNPSVGSWSTNVTYLSKIVVTDAAVPGSSEGNNYLEIYDRDICNTHAIFTDETITGGTLTIEYMAYIPEGDSNAVFALSQDLTGNGLAGALFWVIAYPNNVVGRYDGTTVHDTGVDWAVGVWQEWVFDVNLDTGKFTVSVDGSISSEQDLWRPENTAKNFIFRGGQNGERFYVDSVSVDAIPEPTTMGLLGLGTLGMIVRKKK